MKFPSVFVVTPTFNAADHVVGFLSSIRAQTYKKITVVVIDDGSSDQTEKLIGESYPEATILHGNGSLWWSGCSNRGVKYALSHEADFILTVNVDVELDRLCIEELVKAAAKYPDTLLGSVVIDIKNKDKVWYSGGYIDRKKGDFIHSTGKVTELSKNIISPDWLTGMGVLIPAEAFSKIGYYDQDHFPHYFGDSDFSLRAKGGGFKLAVVPSALVYADLSSAWLEKWLAKPSPLFFWRLFTSRRSQYNVRIRSVFYHRHWGKGWLRALLKLYFITLFSLYRLWAVVFVKRILGRL
jgi:GT2 family glycosyltransferase